MRVLLAIHNAYTDATSGAAHSMRILMQWLADGGHECRVLGTTRFDARPPDSIENHLAALDVPLQRTPPSKIFMRSVKKPANMVVGQPTVDFTLDGVPVTTLLTKAHPGSPAEHFEVEQFLFLLEDLLRQFAPDVLVTYGGHPVVQESMRRARERGVVCVFSLRNRGYEDRTLFRNVDHVFTTSPYLSAVLPSVAEAQPWFDAVCELWDDADAYKRACDLARDTANRWYSESVMRRRYLDYFSSIATGSPLFDDAT